MRVTRCSPPIAAVRMPPLLLGGIGIASVLAVATLGPKYAIIALGLPAGAAAALYTVRRPLVTLLLMIIVEVSNVGGVLAPGSSLPPRASVVMGLLSAGLALRDPAIRHRLNSVTAVYVGIACYLATQTLAVLGSQSVDASAERLRTAMIDCVFLVAVLLLMHISGRPWAAAGAVVVPLALLSVLCLISQIVSGGALSFGGFATVTEAAAIETPRYAGPLGDSNFWGRHLVLGVPLAGVLTVRAIRSRRPWPASAWAAAMLALLAGIYLTQSRGTMISTAVAILVWVIASGAGARRRALKALPLAGLVLFVPGVGDRLIAMFGDVSSSGSNPAADQSILGRMAAQQISWAMFHDRPLFGFGQETFETVGAPLYGGTVRTAIFKYGKDAPGAAHNLYAQFAGETGIVGLVGWALFIGVFMTLLAIRVYRLAPTPAVVDRSLTAAVLAALIGWSLASVFLHLTYFRTLAIVLALAGALAASPVPPQHPAVGATRRPRETALAWTLALTAAIAAVGVSGTEIHTATDRFTILPADPTRSDYLYALDIRRAEVLLPTVASLVTANTTGVTAVGDSVRGVVTISCSGPDPDSARVELTRAMGHARDQFAVFGVASSYTLVELGGVEQSTTRQRSSTGAATGLAIVAAAAVALRYRRRRSRVHDTPGREAPALLPA